MGSFNHLKNDGSQEYQDHREIHFQRCDYNVGNAREIRLTKRLYAHMLIEPEVKY